MGSGRYFSHSCSRSGEGFDIDNSPVFRIVLSASSFQRGDTDATCSSIRALVGMRRNTTQGVIVLNIRIYGLPITSKLGLELEAKLRGLTKPRGWQDERVSATTVDSRSSETLCLDVVFINRIGLEPDAITGLKVSVAKVARDLLNRHRGGHPFRRIVVRMIPTPPEFYEVAELEETP